MKPIHLLSLLFCLLAQSMGIYAQSTSDPLIPPKCIETDLLTACGQENFVMTTRNGPSQKLFGASFVFENRSAKTAISFQLEDLAAGNGYRTEDLGEWKASIENKEIKGVITLTPSQKVTVDVRHDKAYEIFPGCHVRGFYALTVKESGQTFTISAPLNISVEFD